MSCLFIFLVSFKEHTCLILMKSKWVFFFQIMLWVSHQMNLCLNQSYKDSSSIIKKLFWNNYRFTEKCKSVQRNVQGGPVYPSPRPPNVNILYNRRTVLNPGNWHSHNPQRLFRFCQWCRHLLVCVHACACVCSSMQFYHMCGFMQPPPPSRYLTVPFS